MFGHHVIERFLTYRRSNCSYSQTTRAYNIGGSGKPCKQGNVIQTNVGSFAPDRMTQPGPTRTGTSPCFIHFHRAHHSQRYVPVCLRVTLKPETTFLTLVETNSFPVFAVYDFSTTGPGTLKRSPSTPPQSTYRVQRPRRHSITRIRTK